MTENTKERPFLLQGSEAPILRIVDGGDNTLLCAGCESSVLVKGYKPECLVGIGLQCIKCGHITWTPSLPPGETFHFQIVTLGSTGRYLIGSTIQQNANVTITCDQELAMENAESRPRPAEAEPLNLSQDGLGALATELDLLSGGRFGPCLLSAERAIAHGQRYFRENPLAWAIRYLLRQLERGHLEAHEDSLVALGLISGYRHILSRWRHHPHFSYLAQELCSHFHHTFSQLIAASYLSDHGNKIAFSLATQGAGRVADLYVRLSAVEMLNLEVKAPEAIEWPNDLCQRSKMKEIVKKCLSKARGQISTSKPGILIIASSCITQGFFENFEKAIQTTLRINGARRPGIAAVALVGLNKLSLRTGPNSIDFSESYKVIIAKNSHYLKDNPIRP